MKKPSGVTGRLFHCLYISFSARDVAFMQLYSYLCILEGHSLFLYKKQDLFLMIKVKICRKYLY